jgi:hypothetical protein
MGEAERKLVAPPACIYLGVVISPSNKTEFSEKEKS